MIILLLMVTVIVTASKGDQTSPAINQLLDFKDSTPGPVGTLTLSTGATVSYDEATNTFDDDLLNNQYFMETITHFNRERTPERGVHAKGTGAFGYFEVTHDISDICKADFLSEIGKITPIAVRFSSTAGERGITDLRLDFRGFALKFFTNAGNFDLVGFNTPMYLYKDPVNFPGLIHMGRRNPSTNLFDASSLWDALTLLPETLHIFFLTLSGRGIPASYRNMPGFGIHTYQVENKCGDLHFVRWHLMPDAGIKNLGAEETRNISASDPDYLVRELHQAIRNGDCPSWTVGVQILTESDVKKEGYRVMDVTRVIPLNKYPLHPIGKIVLNKNPRNFHAEVEQLAFCPGNLVSGITGAPDRVFQARRMAYRDAQLYRLGANFNKIAINCPFQVKTFTYNRDGNSPVNDNEGDIPNYPLNSFHGPVPSKTDHKKRLIRIIENRENNFDQIADLYSNQLTVQEQNYLIENLISGLQFVPDFIQERAVNVFTTIHQDLGYRVAQGLNVTICN